MYKDGTPKLKKREYWEKIVRNCDKESFLKSENSLFKLEKAFIELEDTELKDRELKIKKDIEELFIKLIIVSIEDMDRFEEEETKK